MPTDNDNFSTFFQNECRYYCCCLVHHYCVTDEDNVEQVTKVARRVQQKQLSTLPLQLPSPPIWHSHAEGKAIHVRRKNR